MNHSTPTTDHFVNDIRGILVDARKQAYTSVNTMMVLAYWKVGQRIVEEELLGKERADYGHYLIRNLAKQLSDEFGKGFSLANLKNCRQFYLTFPEFEKGYAVRSQLSWTHYRLIMRVENPQAREYYLHEAAAHQWSSRQLERNLASHYFERLLAVPNTQSQPESLPNTLPTSEFIKDPYVLEFLDLPETGLYRESTLEAAIITKLQPFLLELGKGFSFVGRQFRISTETSHFYIDLVFYNYLLKCFVLIDLKTTKLKHQDIGQMDMYVRMFDDLKRGADDNPTLGIILCADKDDTVVRYSVLNDSQQLFASKYLHILPSEEELRQALDARHVLQITPDDAGDVA
jgi:predicted nuclease of restriction endonuclease-like (RecB) superfamily